MVPLGVRQRYAEQIDVALRRLRWGSDEAGSAGEWELATRQGRALEADFQQLRVDAAARGADA